MNKRYGAPPITELHRTLLNLIPTLLFKYKNKSIKFT